MGSKFQNENNKSYAGSELLASTEQGLARYNLDLVKKMIKGFGCEPKQGFSQKKVLDFGAGLGALALIWRDVFDASLVCVEIDPKHKIFLESKGFETYASVFEFESLFSFVYTSNVLEHVEDDVLLLSQIRQVMSQEGLIAIYVPALPLLYSDFDISVGHFRRYSKKELIYKVQEAGFEVKSCVYNDVFGIFGSLFVKILGKRGLRVVNSASTLLLFDKIVYPFSKIFDGIVFRYIVGKNLLLIASSNKIND